MFPIMSNASTCRDCYRCLRSCAVKAISFRTGQAKIQADQCILCGRCVKECPQYTKVVIDQIPKLKQYLAQEQVILSLPASYVTYFNQWSTQEFYARLKAAGFDGIEEMAMYSQVVIEQYQQQLAQQQEFIISSHCPAIVELVEKRYPKLISHLAPIANEPSIHSQIIKHKYGNQVKVVHVTPCLATMMRHDYIDLVLTFDQLLELLLDEKVTAQQLAQQVVQLTQYDLSGAKLSYSGGLHNELQQSLSIQASEIQSFSGLKDCMEVLHSLQKQGSYGVRFIELMSCRGGCIGGFGLERKGSILEKMALIDQSIKDNQTLPVASAIPLEAEQMATTFTDRHPVLQPMNTPRVREILTDLKQYNKKLLNCGACGYDTCYEKALAVSRGDASEKMCITYMRAKAESTANTVLRNNPNGIIVFDQDFIIKDFNPVAREMFSKYGLEVGNAIFEYIEHRVFEKVVETGRGIRDHVVHYPDLDLWTRQTIVQMKDSDNDYLAILTDITEGEKKRIELARMKEEMLQKANKVINNQMHVAQQIASLLGETTAETKITLLQLIQQFHDEKELE